MRRSVASSTVIRFILPALLIVALAAGIFLPGTVLAGGYDNGPKVGVEQMGGRTGFQGNPWAIAQPSCSSNRYYSRYPQARPQQHVQYNNGPQRMQPRYVQQPHRVQPQRMQPRYVQQPRYVPQQPARGHYDRDWDNNCGGFTYVVRRGDTLSSIARRYGISEWSLGNANGVRNPNRIYAGQSLHIPSGYCR